ncbi:MAG: hypothetical protein KGL10_07800 [Alphaproteobacteria bacterium]|nr:hypothetical protein [Alphaproteobacteria bacterium]MDE2337200.1 hypothetical protein [Alphaproteobacteria bacterium]
MPDISPQTLVVAIEAVASEIRSLRAALAEGHAAPEEYQLLEDRLRAAADLERAYAAAAKTALNLPPYDALTGGKHDMPDGDPL